MTDLLKYANHLTSCRYRGGHDCDCGLDEIREAHRTGTVFQPLVDLEHRFVKVLDGWEEDGSSPAAVSAIQYALGCVRDAMVGDKRRSGSDDSAPLAQSIEPPLSGGDVQDEFYVWWEANQVDVLHGMITQNCALAAWHAAYDRYVRKALPKSAPPILTSRPSGERLPSSDAAVGGADTGRDIIGHVYPFNTVDAPRPFDRTTTPCFICGRTIGEHSLETADICNAFIPEAAK